MRVLNDLGIRTRPLGGFTIVAFMIVVAAIGVLRLQQLSQRSDDLYTQDARGIRCELWAPR